MAKSYTCTINLNCWKQHTCTCCGGVYGYQLLRTIKGTAPNEAKASARAQKNLEKAVKTDVDQHPCPTCGLYQPDMIAKTRRRTHGWGLALSLILMGILLIVRATDAVSTVTATYAAAIIVAFTALLHIRAELANPNANLSGNLQAAQDRTVTGKVINHQPGQVVRGADQLAARPARSIAQLAGMLLVVAAIVLASAPEILRSSKAWPANEDCYPPVVGPGDTTVVYMTEKISSIKGYWRGRGSATVKTPDGRKITAKAVVKNENNWGDSIYAKSSEKSTSSTPWLEVTMPGDPALGGKTVNCDVALAVVYPESDGSSSFNERELTMHRQITVNLANESGATAAYNSAWWGGTLGAIAAAAVGGFLLIGGAVALRMKAHPTQVLFPQPAAG